MRVRPFWQDACWAALVIVVLISSSSAQTLQLCNEVNSTTGYKVLLDDIRFNTGASDPTDRTLMSLLNFQLKNRFENVGDGSNARYKLIRCVGRIPNGDGSFSPTLLVDLANRDVVLEVWGEVFPPTAGNRRVFLNYAMFPLPAEIVSPFLQQEYKPKVGSSADDIVDWLAQLNELTAYAMVARAVRSVSTSGPAAYDSAKTDLETATASLRTSFGSNPSTSQRQLLSFLVARKCEILHDARINASYHGPLAKVPDAVVNQQCPR